jgi:signal transduction histidine kinase
LLERFFDSAAEEKRHEYLNRIQAAAKHMTQLLDDVLFIGKTAADKQEFKPSPLDLAQFCQGLLEEVQLVSTGDRTISFICPETSIPACMDERLLRRILTNLLSNAIKYSATETIVLFKLSHTDATAIFQIQDTGIGISEEDQRHLFESFHRGKNVGKIPGTGLGLAIVHQSVQLHGGTIAVQSQVNAGTTFTVELPLS